MGKKEADLDGIKYYYDPKRWFSGHAGATVFIVPCSKCGGPTESLKYGRGMRFVCDRCKRRDAYRKHEVEKAWFDVIEEKGEHRYNQAWDAIQAQVKDFSEYEKAARIARQAQDRYGSIPEAMVAVELAKIGLSFVPQQKVGKYRVDFYIPKLKLVIEIDGEVFHANGRLSNREAEIQLTMGFSTRIMHIPAEKIRKDIVKLKPLIQQRMKMP